MTEQTTANMIEPCPVTILTGFLGAGKTTLLQRLLSDPQGVRFGVLVNDFGAINIDADLVAEAGVDQVALSNGCVCCSISDDLIAAVQSLLDAPSPPDRLVIEASGVSRPLAIVDVLETEPRLKVDGVFCLIDADGFETLDFTDTELAMDQAFGSDIALLNKADLVDQATLDRIDATLRDAMPRLRTVPTRQGAVPRDLLFGSDPVRGTMGKPARQNFCLDHDHDHNHLSDFETCAWVSSGPVDADAFRAAMAKMPAGLLRAKGILNLGGRRGVFHLVGKRRVLTVDDGPVPDENRLVAIARRGQLDRQALCNSIDAAQTAQTISH